MWPERLLQNKNAFGYDPAERAEAENTAFVDDVRAQWNGAYRGKHRASDELTAEALFHWNPMHPTRA